MNMSRPKLTKFGAICRHYQIQRAVSPVTALVSKVLLCPCYKTCTVITGKFCATTNNTYWFTQFCPHMLSILLNTAAHACQLSPSATIVFQYMPVTMLLVFDETRAKPDFFK